MATKYKINRVKDANGTLEVVHPETDAEQVLYSNTIGSTTVTTVDGALDALKTLAQNSGVTGVKGNSETTYRTGNVNITPANIGLGNVNNTSDADKPISTATQTALNAKANQSDLSTLQGKVTTLIGGDTGKSVRTVAAEETAKIVAGANTSYDTLKEIADWITSDTTGAAAMNSQIQTNKSDIAGLTETIEEITRGDRNVGVAEDANALGGVAANQYAKLTDIPDDELFIVTGTLEATTISNLSATFVAIRDAIDDGKLVCLKMGYVIMGSVSDYYTFHLADDGDDYLRFRYIDGSNRIFEIYLNSSNDNQVLVSRIFTDISETGTGPIISTIDDSDGRETINFTRRAMQNSDLPNSGVAAGVYSAVQVNSKGVVTAGNQLIEWGTSGQTTPSASLAVGGLFFMKV